jgi:hypothetical protein
MNDETMRGSACIGGIQRPLTDKPKMVRPTSCAGLLKRLIDRATSLYCRECQTTVLIADLSDLADTEHEVVADVILACGHCITLTVPVKNDGSRRLELNL